MKCIRKNKVCKELYKVVDKTGAFICSGLCKSPTNFKHDIITLCLKRGKNKYFLELTVDEAALIAAACTTSIAQATEHYRKLNV